MDRRQFLRSGAAALALYSLPAYAAHAVETPRRVGVVGSGWYGKSSLFRLLQVAPVEVVSLCDVDSRMLWDAAEQVAARQVSRLRPRTYADYREMLRDEELDIVLVATPDHWHALPTIAAIEAGADVYVEKPISLDVAEGRAMLAAARAHGRVVQVNTQRRSTPHLIAARDKIIREGLLGKVGVVEMYCYYHMRTRENPPDAEPPAHLDYDFWTGPAPLRPYNRLVHPRGWRNFMEYGNGIVGDMCIHMLDMVRWMLDLGMPRTVHSAGGILVQKDSKANTTDTQTATFDFGDLQVLWTHRTYGDPPDPQYPWGATFYGEKGTLRASVMSYDFSPHGDGNPVREEVRYELDEYPEDRTERDLERHVAPALRAHWRNFLECVETRSAPVADIEEGYISSTACILANLSQRLGRSIAWDPARDAVAGDVEANRLLRRPYREPWVHPGESVLGGGIRR
jgi:predicted dehydrogenase